MKYPLAAAYVTVVSLCLATASFAQVKINQSRPNVNIRTFDPKHPTKEMPKLQPGEAAVTDSGFSCAVQIEVEITSTDDGKAQMKVTGMDVDLALDVTMWLPTNCPAKIRAHESGHRQISEDFYKNADEIAKSIAKKYIGKTATVASADKKDTQATMQRWGDEFCGEYQGQTEVPSEKVQKRYDELTDHGRNTVPEKKAIEQAEAHK